MLHRHVWPIIHFPKEKCDWALYLLSTIAVICILMQTALLTAFQMHLILLAERCRWQIASYLLCPSLHHIRTEITQIFCAKYVCTKPPVPCSSLHSCATFHLQHKTDLLMVHDLLCRIQITYCSNLVQLQSFCLSKWPLIAVALQGKKLHPWL